MRHAIAPLTPIKTAWRLESQPAPAGIAMATSNGVHNALRPNAQFCKSLVSV